MFAELMITIGMPIVFGFVLAMFITPPFVLTFPRTWHYFIAALYIAPLVVTAKAAMSVLEGYPLVAAEVFFYIFFVLFILASVAGLWDTYAKAHNGTDEETE